MGDIYKFLTIKCIAQLWAKEIKGLIMISVKLTTEYNNIPLICGENITLTEQYTECITMVNGLITANEARKIVPVSKADIALFDNLTVGNESLKNIIKSIIDFIKKLFGIGGKGSSSAQKSAKVVKDKIVALKKALDILKGGDFEYVNHTDKQKENFYKKYSLYMRVLGKHLSPDLINIGLDTLENLKHIEVFDIPAVIKIIEAGVTGTFVDDLNVVIEKHIIKNKPMTLGVDAIVSFTHTTYSGTTLTTKETFVDKKYEILDWNKASCRIPRTDAIVFLEELIKKATALKHPLDKMIAESNKNGERLATALGKLSETDLNMINPLLASIRTMEEFQKIKVQLLVGPLLDMIPMAEAQ